MGRNTGHETDQYTNVISWKRYLSYRIPADIVLLWSVADGECLEHSQWLSYLCPPA